jgi:hypothetical protein
LYQSSPYNAAIPPANIAMLAKHAAGIVTIIAKLYKNLLVLTEDFLPLLPSASDIKIGVIDYIIKIVGGALTFVLPGVALRRKFERKYTR